MTNLLFYFYSCFLFTSIAKQPFCLVSCEETVLPKDEVVKIAVRSQSSGKEYNLKLTKADESFVLHPNIRVISITGAEEEQANSKVEDWTSSKSNVKRAQQGDVYIDSDNLAAVRLAWDSEKNEHYPVDGVVNGNRLVKDHENARAATVLKDGSQSNNNQSDYIDMKRNLTISPDSIKRGPATPTVVEVVLVCDKEFADKFNHDRQRIVDYWTVYFWDVNMRYRTLPNINISFRINAIVIISSPAGQPFIEESRASDGRAEFGRILERFSFWIYRQRGTLPKFDIAIAVTNTQLEWGGGLAYYRAACWVDNNSGRNLATAVWNDGGDWGSLTVGAHEIGHVVGAPHDDDPNYPGGRCSDRGFIMSGGNDDLKWFFGPCSDRTIGEFVNTNEASCLRRLDETSRSPEISPDFSSVLAPSMNEQCQRRLNNPQAFIPEQDTANCKVMKCWVPSDGGWLIWSLAPVDNSPCIDGGRCFRGRCRKIGKLLRNVATGECARAQNPFYFQTALEMVSCPNPLRGATPLEQFTLEDSPSNGKFLRTPWNSPDAKENGDKCLYTGRNDGDALWTDRCNNDNPWHGWDVNYLRQGAEFLLRHKVSGNCAKQEGSWVKSYRACNSNDASFRWRFV